MGLPIIGDIIGAVKGLASEVIVDKDKRDEMLLQLQEIEDRSAGREHDERMAQIDVNKVEAQHASLFVSGWRPFIGWVGGVALAWAFIVKPSMEWIVGRPLPDIDIGELLTLVFALLGFGIQRSFDKVRGTSLPAKPQTTPIDAPAVVAGDPVAAAATPTKPRRWKL